MSKKKAPAKLKVPKMPKGEAEQVRIRRDLGHDFALTQDEHGRTRLIAGSADAARIYDVSNGGYVSTGGIVRVRRINPLSGIPSLTEQQRAAGLKFGEVYEYCATEGIRTGVLQERVDGSGKPCEVPDHLLDAAASLGKAKLALSHHEIIGVVEDICGKGMTVKAVADQNRDQRFAVVKLLKIGLDILAVHYGIVRPGKGKRAA